MGDSGMQNLSVVAVGAFNPAIFHPSWFFSEGLLPEQPSEAPDLDIVHPQVARFRLDWVSVQVDADRFQVSTSDASAFEPLRDLAQGVFRLLRHTPVRAIGVNTAIHSPIDSDEALDALLDRLAPTGSWTELLTRPGLSTLVFTGERPDTYEGHVRVQVEPSARLRPGLYVDVNDHFAAPDPEGDRPADAEFALEVLTKSWDDSLRRARHLADRIRAGGAQR